MSMRRARCRCSSSWCARSRRTTANWRATRWRASCLPGCAARARAPPPKPEIARVRGACLRDHGGEGPPAVLIPSLINPPQYPRPRRASVAGRGSRADGATALLLDWGAAGAAIGAERRRACRAIAAAVAAQHRRAGRARRLLPRRDDGDRRGQSGTDANGSRPSPRHGISRSTRSDSRSALEDMWRHSQGAQPRPRRAADGSAAGGLLVARSGADGRASSPSSAGSIRTAPRRGASSCSRTGRMRASPCPTPQRAS